MARIMAAAWLGIAPDDPFGLDTLPYGSFTPAHRPGQPRAGVAVGDRILDLGAVTGRLLPGRAHLFSGGNLDLFLAAGRRAWEQVRAGLQTWLSDEAYREAVEDLLVRPAPPSCTGRSPWATTSTFMRTSTTRRISAGSSARTASR